MMFEINGRKVEILLSEAKAVKINGVECYKFSLELGYMELADTVSAKFICSEGESREFSYSVKEYGEYILKNKKEAEYSEASALVQTLLNYGAYTQKYFGHSKYNPANSSLANKDVSYVTKNTLEKYRITEAQGGTLVTPAGSSLTLEPLTLRLYFNREGAADLSFTLNGNELSVGEYEEYIYVEISGISLGSLDSFFEIAVSDGESTEYIKYNLFAYLHLAVSSNHETFTPEFKDTLRALYLYNKAAQNYNK
jgi:hypothetical protein